MAAVLDFGAYSPAELTAILTAAKAEYLVRLTGKVQQGSSAAQSYGLTVMTVDDLVRLINGLTTQLGLDNSTVVAQPNFNTTRPPAPYPGWASTFGAS